MPRKLLAGLLLLAPALFLAADARAATLTVTVMSRAGQDVTALAASADAAKTDKWLNTGAEFFVIVNGSGSPTTATLNLGVGGIVDGQTPSARTVTVLAGHTAVMGPFPTNFYNDSNGYASITYSAVTTVTVLVVRPGS
ncbi:MAG TPA: hypothetical protein VMS17_16680 [Gemmataceae bacterium]|nr:hypothetical protein [Gemmataceae bacterium]